jgi:nucleoid-associated protein YgaU
VSVRIRNNSRLQMTDLLTVDGVEFWDTVVFPSIPTSDADVYHEVRAGDRIDNLANHYYSDPVLWWVIAVANDLELLPTELMEGKVLRIPAIAVISPYIQAPRSGNG